MKLPTQGNETNSIFLNRIKECRTWNKEQNGKVKQVRTLGTRSEKKEI